MKAASAVDLSAGAIDPENPWLGLFSYSEDTRAYFHGRDEETAELARRVQRKLLTTLFGQSGLGKTSLLRAGLVPRLRAEGYCPVYVRVDYAPDSPAAAEQIKQAILRTSAEAGTWTRPGSAIAGETLWEFMHHRGDLLRDAAGHTLMPLLIFDQFEEIFTLAQADDAGRRRAQEFLDELADLVENRPPAALEARLEKDDAAADDFDFARADYRVLIALREDYLAHLESVKKIMPSITQNRMRLARMTGAQALSAVLGPGGRLVSQEVAESIVRFVAGGSELANAEIEPSLLSLVCRELNSARQLQGRAEISADLLAGTRDSILSEFYERALADQPDAVRRVIEDELLTESGYRESLAEERVAKALAAAGAAPDALAKLVDRRLLRIEERLDMRRVELTHDVLCSVVLSSRDKRHEREARELAQRQLAEQEAMAASSHRALVRARMIATVCTVLMLISIASAAWGWMNLQRARAADAAAQKSRADAEKLVGFLIEDFYSELEPTGRLDTLGKLAHMTVDYYDGLPPALVTPRTQSNRAMALIREAAALSGHGDAEGGYRKFAEAQKVFEQLRAAGDHSEPTTWGLGLALFSQGIGVIGGARGTPQQLQQAADLLRPLAYGPNPSRRVRQTYADTLNILSHTQPLEQGVATCEEARKVLAGLGALDLSDLNAASAYADTADSEARHTLSLGRVEQAQKLETEVFEMAEKVLAQRPGDLRSMANRYFAADMLTSLANRRHDDAAAADYARRATQAAESYLLFQPTDLRVWGYVSNGKEFIADNQWDRGEIGAAIATRRELAAMAQDKRRPSSLGPILANPMFRLAMLEREAGQLAASEHSLKVALADMAETVARFAPDDARRQLLSDPAAIWRSGALLMDGDAAAAYGNASRMAERIAAIKIATGDRNGGNVRDNILRTQLRVGASAALKLGRFAQAEAMARRRLALPPDQTTDQDPFEEKSAARSQLAHALVMQGRVPEALTQLAPALAYYRLEQERNAHGFFFRRAFAYALFVSALTHEADKAQRAADLAQATALIDGMTADSKALYSAREIAALIAAARAGGRAGRGVAIPKESGAGLFEVPLVIGVTSHRNLAPAEIEPIRRRIADFFAQLKREFPEMPLVVLSALAEGGDQLAAREALAAGARLIAPLPLLPQTYSDDFVDAATREGFEELRQRSEVLQMPLLPGDSLADISARGEARDRQYAQAGVFIASHCHILLALWDGRESNLLGGTAQVVRYALDGVMPGWIERRRSERAVLNRIDESIVFHIACSRVDADGSVQGPGEGLAPLQARWLSQDQERDADAGMQPEFRRMFAHMREFDLDQRRYGAEILAGAEQHDGSIIDRLFAAADVLAIHFQKRVLWVIRSIHVLAAATGVAFVAYSDLPADVPVQYYAIYLFIALFAAGMIVAWLARRRDWHRKYIDYRALAEGLRVQRYWRRAGVTTRSPSAFAHDRFMQKTEVELGWIRNVMRVPSMERIDDAPVNSTALQAVIAEWIGGPGCGGQLEYYTRKTEHRTRMQRTTHMLGQASLWAGFAIVLFLAVAQRRIGSDTTGLLLAILAVVGIVAAARESYAYRKGDKELIQQYRYMRGVFADARAKIDAEPSDEGKRKILRALGEVALAEHSEWALMHRQRPLDNARL